MLVTQNYILVILKSSTIKSRHLHKNLAYTRDSMVRDLCACCTCSNGLNLYKFPRDPATRQQWVKQVQRTRPQWSGPSEHSVLCSKHFADSCFEPESAL